MPDRPTWLERIPAILEQLQDAKAPPFLDRPTLEMLFGVRRRQAINLLRRFRGYQVGRTFLVSREAVIQFLENPQLGEALQEEQAQKQHVSAFLGQARHVLSLPHIPIPPASKPSEMTWEGLAAGIRLTPGRLSIEFQNATELLEKLYSLSQALAHDFETFERVLQKL